MPFLAPIFAAAGAAVGTAVSSAFTVGGLIKMVVNLLINVGLALLQMALTRTPKPEDIKTVFKQSVPMRFVHLGRVRAGGPLVFLEVANRTLYQVFYLGEGEVDGFEEYFLDSRSVEIDSDGWVTTRPYGSRGGQRVQIQTRRGLSTSTVYEPLKAAFPGVVTNAWRGAGLATAMVSAISIKPEFVQRHYPNGFPQFNTIARFGQCYDPRTGNTAWTDSLPLLLLEYLTSPNGAGIPRDLIDMEDFARGARVAAQIVPTKGGGTTRRYHGSLSWNLGERPGDVITRLLMHMDGRLFLRQNGKIGFQVGEWIAPTVHIPDNVILDAELQDGSSPIAEANEIVVRWTNPNASYSEAACDPWRNQVALDRANGRFKNTTVDLYGIQSHNHARRIAKILDQKLNPRWTGTIRTSMAGMEAWDQRFITVSYADLEIVDQTFEVVQISFDEDDLTVTMQISAVEPTLYAFDAETEEGTIPVDPQTLDDGVVPTPEGLAVEWTADTVRGRRMITAEVSVDMPKRGVGDQDAEDIKFEFQYSRADRNRWRDTVGVSDEREVEIEDLVENRLYDFRCRQRAGLSEPSNWVVLENQKAIDPIAPSRPTRVRVRRVGEEVQLTLLAPSEVQTAQIQIWRGNTPAWRQATSLAVVDCTPGESFVWIDQSPKKNARYYFVAALNGSGRRSTIAPAINNPLRT